MIARFIQSKLGQQLLTNKNEFEKHMMTCFRKFSFSVFEKNKKEHEIDVIVGKQIITHLEEFFKKTKKNKTLKFGHVKRNKTMKHMK
jgi:hypothetical protein